MANDASDDGDGLDLTLLTDLYQLTMASGYWARKCAQRRAVFHLYFRRSPFQGGYVVAAGLQPALEYLSKFRFRDQALAYLSTLRGNDGLALFPDDFLRVLSDLRLTVDVHAVPEGTVVFPNQPLLRIEGPIMQCQLLESTLLNIINFQSLIATKAARIVQAAAGDAVLEFGLRRAQGVDGALSASRAAFIGGCAATSNVLAGMRFGIPVRGTHAHSWVMSFDSELESFAEYAAAMPNNCVFLVDTYDTIAGVRHAIEIGQQLRTQGHEMVGIRLDSGDLAWLSQQARRLLDEAGFPRASIVASNDLDERLIQSLKSQGSAINVWGVGTKLATAYDQPALGGVYKLAAIEERNHQNSAAEPPNDATSPSEAIRWRPVLKLSEQPSKVSTPGKLQVRRFFSGTGEARADMIFNELDPPRNRWTMVHPEDATQLRTFAHDDRFQDLLIPVMTAGQLTYERPTIANIQKNTQRELEQFHSGIRRFDNPHRYPVGLEQSLHELRQRLMRDGRAVAQREGRRS